MSEMKKTSQLIEEIEESGEGSEYGPYSHSRLDNHCGFWFKKQYIDKEKGLELSPFDTEFGKAMHNIAEYDVKMRIHKDADDWLSPEDLVEVYLDLNPDHQDYMQDLTEQLNMFRFNFEINRDHYVASEQDLGVRFDMSSCDYDDPGAWFRGWIDYLEIDIDQGMARVVDYKNYPRIHSEYQINDTSRGVGCQLMGYGAMVMAMYPHVYQMVYEVYYTRFGTSRTSCYKDDYGIWQTRYISRDEVDRWWRFNQRRMLAKERKKSWDANPSHSNCRYCNHFKSCPWFQSQDEYIAADDEQAKELLNRLVVIKKEESIIKSALDEFDNEIENDAGEKYGYTEYESVSVNPKIFLAVCRKAGIDPGGYISINKTNLDKLIKRLDDSEHIDLLEEGIQRVTKTRKVTPR